MKTAIISLEGLIIGPRFFQKEDIEKAREYGAFLKVNFSNTIQERYLSNTCGKCGAFTGEFYLHDYFHLMTAENGYQMGYACPECDYPNE